MPGLTGVVQASKTQTLIGRLRHRIQLVQTTNSQDDTGGWNASSNTVLLTTWASIEALSASEKFAAHEFVSQVTHKIWIRHPRNSLGVRVTADQQIWFNQRTFQIEGVLNPVERKDMLCLMCIEIDDSSNQASASSAESSL